MKIRDQHATVTGKEDEISEFSNGIEILTDDGRQLFSISFGDDKTQLRIDGGTRCVVNGIIYDDNFRIQPIAHNCVVLYKNKYE